MHSILAPEISGSRHRNLFFFYSQSRSSSGTFCLCKGALILYACLGTVSDGGGSSMTGKEEIEAEKG